MVPSGSQVRHVLYAQHLRLSRDFEIMPIVLDGVYADPENTGTPRFFALSPVSDEEVARVTSIVAKRVVALLIRRGLLEEDGPAGLDPLAEEEPLLAACAQARVGIGLPPGCVQGNP